MAKLDLTKIEGYADMTAEEKIAALEAYEVAEPDYKGYIKKDSFDKTASELAEWKRKYRAALSEDEQKKQKEQEERDKLQAAYDALLHETNVSKNKAKLLGIGYEEKLAEETAEAMVNGDLEKVIANQRKHITSFEQKIRAAVLNETPAPIADGGSDTMTMEKLRGMSFQDREDYAAAHPDEYKKLYGGNE